MRSSYKANYVNTLALHSLLFLSEWLCQSLLNQWKFCQWH